MTIIKPNLELYVPSVECAQQYIALAKKSIFETIENKEFREYIRRNQPELLQMSRKQIEEAMEEIMPSQDPGQEDLAELVNDIIVGCIDRNLALQKRLPFKVCDYNGNFYSHAEQLVADTIPSSETDTESVSLIGKDLYKQVKEKGNIGLDRFYRLHARAKAVYCQIDPDYTLREPPKIGQPLEVIYDLEL